MIDASSWLARRLRPPRGWIAFLLLLAALLCLPLSVMQAAQQWRPPAALGGLESVTVELLALTLVAAIASLLVGQTRLARS